VALGAHPKDWKMHPSLEFEYWILPKIKEKKKQVDARILEMSL
jgi:hypothetical protein